MNQKANAAASAITPTAAPIPIPAAVPTLMPAFFESLFEALIVLPAGAAEDVEACVAVAVAVAVLAVEVEIIVVLKRSLSGTTRSLFDAMGLSVHALAIVSAKFPRITLPFWAWRHSAHFDAYVGYAFESIEQ